MVKDIVYESVRGAPERTGLGSVDKKGFAKRVAKLYEMIYNDGNEYCRYIRGIFNVG